MSMLDRYACRLERWYPKIWDRIGEVLGLLFIALVWWLGGGH